VKVTDNIERYGSAVIVAAVILPLAVCAILAIFRDDLSAAIDVLVVVMVVVAAASTGVRTAGLVAALSGGVWFDFFLTQPYQRLAIGDPNDVEAAILLVVIGAAVTEIALWGRRQQARASQRAGYLDGVLGTAEIVTLRSESPKVLLDHISGQIQQVLSISGCRFVTGPVRDEQIPLLDHHGLVTRQGHPVNVDRDGLPTDDEIALQVTRAGVAVGHFLLTASARIARPTVEQRKVAVLLADQAGSALSEPNR
jgi:K+-sensing histidine kinase KdpD